jgi:hypothetical protein
MLWDMGRLYGKVCEVQLIVPQSAKCFYSKMVKRCALTNVNYDRGF